MNLMNNNVSVNRMIMFLICLLPCIHINCTFVYKPEVKNDVNKGKKNTITLNSILSDPKKYSAYDSKYTDLLKEKYLEAMAVSRTEYIKVISKAEELGINKSPYLDSCCNHIKKSILF